MADRSYLTLCPHCESYLPGRTFRRHRESFFDARNNRWEKDEGLLESSSGDETPFLEISQGIDHSVFRDSDSDVDDPGRQAMDDNLGELLNNEVWDDTLVNDIDEDFSENHEVPSIEVNSSNRSSSRTLVNCLIILLAYFWTYFRISDSAMEFLLSFLKKFFEVAALSNNWFAALALAFPGTLYYFRKEIGFVKDSFTKYVVCPKCSAIYKFEDSYRTVGSRKVSKTCSYVKFPNHRQRRMRNPCGTTLLKEVTLKDGTKRLYPHKVYCYKSIIASLKEFVKRGGFTESCELWRNREIRSVHQIMCDVFEGRVWRDFQTYSGSPFLSAPRNYAFMLNVDWMQPFDHTQYSIGVLYLALMNLPRSERFKRQNIFLVGVIPGPNEPKLNINSYLSPLVDELLILWEDGVRLRHSGSPLFPECFKAALLCVACDMPASRKLCGFTGHNSRCGCNKCTKKFQCLGIGEATDYSGFEQCLSRNTVEHRRQVREIQEELTQDARNAKESLYGVRYSELLRLPYFDCVRFTIVDPMHNLFLGTAKRMMEIWLQLNILTRADLEAAQNKVDATHVPSNLGRIPFRIATSFAGFTAEQWKAWVTVFSSFALFGHLPDNDYICWVKFVMACKLLSRPLIKIADIGAAHALLHDFCCAVEQIYGNSRITPNMHMHTHLADCILDYGPIYSFWLFSFERYNGILGNYYTNNKSIELQVMRKFLRDQNLRNLEFPEEFKGHFEQLIDKLEQSNIDVSGVDAKALINVLQLSQDRIDLTDDLWFSVADYSFGSPHVVENFDDDELQYIAEVYKLFLPTISSQDIPQLYDKYASVECAGERYGSEFSRLNRSSFVLARWVGRFDGSVDTETADERPCVIRYFAKQSICFGLRRCTFCFARVSWFQRHLHQFLCGRSDGTPKVWCANVFESFGPASFIPVQRISRKFIAGYDKVGGENVLFVLPLEKKSLL